MKLIKIEQQNCPSCVLVSNFLEDNEVKYDKIDVNEHPEAGGKFGIMSVPVTILLDDEGNEIKRCIGFKPNELEDIINSL